MKGMVGIYEIMMLCEFVKFLLVQKNTQLRTEIPWFSNQLHTRIRQRLPPNF